MIPEPTEAPFTADALWDERLRRRRRLDAWYRRLNGTLFLILLLVVLVYFRELWGQVADLFGSRALGAPR